MFDVSGRFAQNYKKIDFKNYQKKMVQNSRDQFRPVFLIIF